MSLLLKPQNTLFLTDYMVVPLFEALIEIHSTYLKGKHFLVCNNVSCWPIVYFTGSNSCDTHTDMCNKAFCLF